MKPECTSGMGPVGTNGKSPLARARDAWLESDEARMLQSRPINLPSDMKYMRNRLELAFIAGYEAREKEGASNGQE